MTFAVYCWYQCDQNEPSQPHKEVLPWTPDDADLQDKLVHLWKETIGLDLELGGEDYDPPRAVLPADNDQESYCDCYVTNDDNEYVLVTFIDVPEEEDE